MPQSYTLEFKKKMIRLHEEEGRTYKSITAEYGVSKASISKWYNEFGKEYLSSPKAKYDNNTKELFDYGYAKSPTISGVEKQLVQ